MWFEQLTGFRETPHAVQRMLQLDGTIIHSHANGRQLVCGEFEALSLWELKQRLEALPTPTLAPAQTSAGTTARLQFSEKVADAQKLHQDPANAGALFQVASQFNALEMISPDISPEHGISGYQYDRTQGPACAMACGAGTLYRQYFLPLTEGQWPSSQPALSAQGQTAQRQLDLAARLHQALQQAIGRGPLWRMKNGYLLPEAEALTTIGNYLQSASEAELAKLRQSLQLALQWQTEVTLGISERTQPPSSKPVQGHLVSQIYCSALPVAYSQVESQLWRPFAQLVLDAAYEATLAAGVLNANRTGNNTVFLTMLGGGAFGNRPEWIINAIDRALGLYQQYDLNVVMVSYGCGNPEVQRLVERLGNSDTSC